MRATRTELTERPEMEWATAAGGLAAPSSGSHDAGAPGVIAGWVRFVLGVLGILLLLFGVLPAVQRLGPVRDVHEAIERSGIDATALFYSEIDVSSEAELSIRDALKYPARRVDD